MKNKTQPPCPKCGSLLFLVRYTETAHARVDQDGEVLEDGRDLVHHEKDYSMVWCSSCGEQIKWVGRQD